MCRFSFPGKAPFNTTKETGDFLQIFLAGHAGFCFGVKRAIQLAQKASKQRENLSVFTYGPLIHNPQLVAKLEAEGIKAIEKSADASNGVLIIRSHGVGPKTFSELNTKFKIIDATCPFVSKAQKLVKSYHDKGYQIVILGNKNHPEVVGLNEWAANKALVVENERELMNVDLNSKIALIPQTTQKRNLFNKVASLLQAKSKGVIICDTICPATDKRQNAALELAKNVDLMIVVGGRNSSNTIKLAEICQNSGTTTYHIEEAKEIKPNWFNKVNKVGVTAGASTPDWIIEEVIQKMIELNEKAEQKQGNSAQVDPNTNEAELQMSSDAKDVHKGDIVEGKVVKIAENEIIIDFGGKSEGIIPLSELSVRNTTDPSEFINIGDSFRVIVIQEENDEGQPVFSKKRADRILAWDNLEEAMNSKKKLKATVIEVVKGGVLVDVGIKGFVPASLLELGYVENLEEYLGKELRLRVIEIDKEKQRVVLSQKVILDEEHEQRQKELWETLQVGDIKTGIVKRITNFGAFIDIGDIEGLLHVSELAWGRVNHPSDVLKEGQEIKVKIIGLDKEKEKISLSMKELLPDPWHVLVAKYKLNDVVNGKVLRTVPFGAFVELEPGVEGLVHISQLANHHVAKTEDVVKSGDKVKVKIIKIDEEAKKISLSIKQAEDAIPETKSVPVNNYQTSDNNLTLGDVFGDLFTKKEDE